MKYNSTNRGFTLIEIIVSLAVFVVVAVIAVGAFLKVLDANKQSQSLQTAMNNANFALESMVRDLRVGYAYDCYDSFSNSYPSSIVKTACPGSPALFVGSPSSLSRFPTIAFYSSQFPDGWNCVNPPVHAYRYNPTTNLIEKSEQTLSACTGSNDDTKIGDSNSPFIPLTSADFKIQSFGLMVNGTTQSNQQPEAFIYMQASAGSNLQNRTIFTIQTTASQRIMNGL